MSAREQITNLTLLWILYGAVTSALSLFSQGIGFWSVSLTGLSFLVGLGINILIGRALVNRNNVVRYVVSGLAALTIGFGVLAAGKIGMLFIDFETPNRVRVQATAALDRSGQFDEHFPGAIAIVRATIDQVFVNCARYIHKHARVEPSPYVPDADGEQPFATWKRIDGIQPFLPEKDRGGAEAAGGTITDAEYAAALEAGES